MTTPTPPDNWQNKLYFGDNLPIMWEHIPAESVDLIYLDPPFNSNATLLRHLFEPSCQVFWITGMRNVAGVL